MSETSKILGNGPTLESLGKTWRLSTATWAVQDAFEAWLERRRLARLKARRKRAEADDDNDALAEIEEELEAFRDRCDAGAMSWRGRVFTRALRTPDGITYLLYLLLHEHHPEVDEAGAKEILFGSQEEAGRLMAEVISDLPNSRPPEAGASR